MIISSLPKFLISQTDRCQSGSSHKLFAGICRGLSFFSSTYIPRRFRQKVMKNVFYLCSWELMGRMHSIQGDKNGLFVHCSNIFCSELNCSH